MRYEVNNIFFNNTYKCTSNFLFVECMGIVCEIVLAFTVHFFANYYLSIANEFNLKHVSKLSFNMN